MASDPTDDAYALAAALALQALKSGGLETLDKAEFDAYPAAPTPLAFWRERRGLAATALAEVARVAPDELARLDAGQAAIGDVRVYARLAAALRLRIEDLVPDDRTDEAWPGLSMTTAASSASY